MSIIPHLGFIDIDIDVDNEAFFGSDKKLESPSCYGLIFLNFMDWSKTMNTKTDLFRTNITQLKGKYELTREMVHFNGSSQEKKIICGIKELGLLLIGLSLIHI